MRLSDYIGMRIIDPQIGTLRRSGLILWALWALMVKPGAFRVADSKEEIELGLASGTLRLFLSGMVGATVSLALQLVAVIGTLVIALMLLLSPLWLPVLHLMAWFRHRRVVRAHAKALKKVRDELKPTAL